jgi:catalase
MGDFPERELGLQLFDEDFAERFDFDVLDATKIVPEEDVPVRRVGRLVLDRCVDNFFAETEQVAFCTQNIVPGVDFTNDPLLQGRNFSYLDTHLKRLGSPNFAHIPINAPKCPFHYFSAGRAHGHDESERQGQLRAQFLERGGCGSARIARKGFSILPRR